jgi:hypothetical protein
MGGVVNFPRINFLDLEGIIYPSCINIVPMARSLALVHNTNPPILGLITPNIGTKVMTFFKV